MGVVKVYDVLHEDGTIRLATIREDEAASFARRVVRNGEPPPGQRVYARKTVDHSRDRS